jgi:2-methylcitrate dehydratase PrpD
MSVTRTATTRELASFLSGLRFEDLPDEVVERTKELFLDWAASALAGKNARPVEMDRIIGRVWSLDLEPEVRNLLPEA